MSTVFPNRLLSVNDLVAFNVAKRSTIFKWLAMGAFPQPMRIGPGRKKLLRWKPSAIEAWQRAKQ